MRARREARAAGDVDPRLRAELVRWQAERLARTHGDLLRSQRHGKAVRFFLTHLYAPRDFTDRDRQLEGLAPTLARVLPEKALSTLSKALEMNALTGELDDRLARIWRQDLGARRPLDEATYCRACRLAADREERLRQIDLLVEVGRELDRVVARPLLYPALLMAREPARAAGLGSLHGLLLEGFQAFRHMRGAGPFLATLERRERAMVEAIFNGQAPPLP